MEKRRTTTIQVNPELNLVLTKYATDQGISKSEAADRIFNILYPKGVGIEAPLAPPERGEEGQGAEETPGFQAGEGEEDISDELHKTVKDLRAVQTIRALTDGMKNEKGEDGKITSKDAFELKKLEAMFGRSGNKSEGDPDALDATFRKYIEPLQAQIKGLEGKVQDMKVSEAEKDRDFYKKQLDDRDAKDERQTEIEAYLGPVQGQLKELGGQIAQLAELSKPGSDEKPTSDELKAINILATEIKTGIARLGAAGAGGGGGGEPKSESFKGFLDDLVTVIDKVQEVGTKFRGGEASGDFDWRAASISTIGEVATEAIKAYKDITVPGLAEEEEKGEGKEEKKDKENLSQQLVLKRVYNYAVKKISEGQLQLNTYEAAKELNLTENQVWWAVDSLRKRGMLKAGSAPGTQPDKEEPEHEPATGGDEIARAEAKGLLEF